MFGKKRLFLVSLFAVLALTIAACQAEPEVITVVETRVVESVVVETQVVEIEGEAVEVEVTRVVEEIVEVEVEVPAEDSGDDAGAAGAQIDTYTISLFEDPLTLNPWDRYGPSSSVWTAYALDNLPGSVYNLADQSFAVIPGLAVDLAEDPVEDGDLFAITVSLRDGQVWSDGEAIDANDVAFSLNTCLNLALTSGWADICPSDFLVGVEAVDDLTVTYLFSQVPGLAVWQYGVAQAPVLPEHFWGPIVDEALAFVADYPEQPADCSEEAPEEDVAACEAYSNARTTLYSADPTGQPFAGAYVTDSFEPGAFVAKTANPNYGDAGTQVTLTSDGQYTETFADGTSRSYYGDGSGDTVVDYVIGPQSENIIMTLYGSQDAAYLAMADGEVDYVLNPLSIASGLRSTYESDPNIQSIVNPDNGLFYLAYNFRKMPMGNQEFRTAVDCLIDKEFVAGSILQNSVIPTYSVVPSGNAFWYNPDVTSPCIGLSREERLNSAVDTLTAAGWTWDVAPAWNADTVDVDPGEGMTMPDGTAVPDLVILGPGPSYDPQRASFNQWISEWMRELGVPVESELTGFNTILNPVFVDADFDMYILGWGLGIYPDYMCSFFDSRNDTLATGGNNTPGHNFPEYDALCDEFLAETNIETAREQAYALQEFLGNTLPYTPLFNRQAIDLVRTNVEYPYTDLLGGIADQNGFQRDAKVFSTSQ